MGKREDSELVKRALDGDSDSYGELAERYRGAVYGLAYHLTGSFSDADDITQMSLYQAFDKLHQLRDAKSFPAWLQRITANNCRLRFASRRVSRPVS